MGGVTPGACRPAIAIGLTPKAEVYRRKKARLYRYAGTPWRRAPVLLVPNLAMTRPDLFDLQPGASLIEFLLGRGFDAYLLDWGVFADEDCALTIDECVEETLRRALDRVLRVSGARECSLVGYCMGATLSLCHLALHPDAPVRALAALAGPVDFAKGGLFRLWFDRRCFDVDRLADTFAVIPPEFFRFFFWLIRPAGWLSASLSLWANAGNETYVVRHRALQQWSDTYVPMPGEFFRQWIRDFYQDNRLAEGTLRLAGAPVALHRIRCPVLTIVGTHDPIVPPDAARALIGLIGGGTSEILEVPGGHAAIVVGRHASTHVWPRLAEWLAAPADPPGRPAPGLSGAAGTS